MLDEIQRVPELFATLRGVIDESRRHGPANGRFLLSGSASITFLKQSSESLAGRIAFVELKPLDVLETPAADLTRLWVRGGLPPSFLQAFDQDTLLWREELIRTYLGGSCLSSARGSRQRHCDGSGRCSLIGRARC